MDDLAGFRATSRAQEEESPILQQLTWTTHSPQPIFTNRIGQHWIADHSCQDPTAGTLAERKRASLVTDLDTCHLFRGFWRVDIGGPQSRGKAKNPRGQFDRW